MNTTSTTKGRVISVLPSVFVAAAPILSPYALVGNLSLTFVLGLVCALLYFVFYRTSIVIEKRNYPFVAVIVTLILLSFNGFLVLHNLSPLINSLVMLVVAFLCYALSWCMVKFETVVKISTFIAWLCVLFAVYQWFVTMRGGIAPLGQLPFFNVKAGWVQEHWGFRFNSLFAEPSYFALYLLPLFAYHLKHNHLIHALVMAGGIILSSSTLGIFGMVGIVFCNLLLDARYRLRTMIAVVVLGVVLLFIYFSLPEVQAVVDRTLQKVVRVEFDNLRILGYLDYYQTYSPKEMLLGVGMNQFQNYMGQRGITVHNYSNTIVYMLLQSGLLGLLALLAYFGWLTKYAFKNKSFVFALICFLLLAFDYAMFSDRFYFLFYFALYYSNQSGKQGRRVA